MYQPIRKSIAESRIGPLPTHAMIPWILLDMHVIFIRYGTYRDESQSDTQRIILYHICIVCINSLNEVSRKIWGRPPPPYHKAPQLIQGRPWIQGLRRRNADMLVSGRITQYRECYIRGVSKPKRRSYHIRIILKEQGSSITYHMRDTS